MISRHQEVMATTNDAQANETIVMVDGTRRNLSNLSSRKLKSISLYPTIADLPSIETTDQIWASSFRRRQPMVTAKKSSTEGSSSDNGSNGEEPKQEEIEQVADPKPKGDSDVAEEPPSCSDDFADRKMVEVTPGHFVPLRGAEETMQALDYGKVTQTTCVNCNVALVVHEAASMVICPDCEVIAPLLGKDDSSEASLGLGLRLETLQLSEEAMVVGKSAVGHLKRDPDEEEQSAASF